MLTAFSGGEFSVFFCVFIQNYFRQLFAVYGRAEETSSSQTTLSFYRFRCKLMQDVQILESSRVRRSSL